LRPFGSTWFVVEDDGLLLIVADDDDDEVVEFLELVILKYFSLLPTKIRFAGFRCLLQIDLRAFNSV